LDIPLLLGCPKDAVRVQSNSATKGSLKQQSINHEKQEHVFQTNRNIMPTSSQVLAKKQKAQSARENPLSPPIFVFPFSSCLGRKDLHDGEQDELKRKLAEANLELKDTKQQLKVSNKHQDIKSQKLEEERQHTKRLNSTNAKLERQLREAKQEAERPNCVQIDDESVGAAHQSTDASQIDILNERIRRLTYANQAAAEEDATRLAAVERKWAEEYDLLNASYKELKANSSQQPEIQHDESDVDATQEIRLDEALAEGENLQEVQRQLVAQIDQLRLEQHRTTEAASAAEKRASDVGLKYNKLHAFVQSKQAEEEAEQVAAKQAASGDTTVHVAFNTENAQRQYSSWVDAIVKQSGLSVQTAPAPPQGRVKLLLYTVFLATPRLEQRIDRAKLAEWAGRADKIVVVALRVGAAVQPLQTDTASVKACAPQADALIEYLFNKQRLYDGDTGRMNEGSNKRMCEIMQQVFQFQTLTPATSSWGFSLGKTLSW
jgi:hypothetical protein